MDASSETERQDQKQGHTKASRINQAVSERRLKVVLARHKTKTTGCRMITDMKPTGTRGGMMNMMWIDAENGGTGVTVLSLQTI